MEINKTPKTAKILTLVPRPNIPLTTKLFMIVARDH